MYVLLRDRTTLHRLWVEGPPQPAAPLVALVTLDDTAPIRIPATLHFWRHVASGRSQIHKATSQQRHERLAQALRALDGRLSGATYRVIAEGIHGRDRIEPETWKTTSMRDMTIRLVRSGLALMKGGYRKLLGSKRNS